MKDDKEVIREFYAAFQAMDADKMVSYYSDEVVFSDPAFGELRGERAKNMWGMLIESQEGKDFKVTFDQITNTSAAWEAKYSFGKSERKVHNKISAKFTIKDGLILTHTDDFNLRNWAKQAMGFSGWLFGGTTWFKNKLQVRTNGMLDKYEAKKSKTT